MLPRSTRLGRLSPMVAKAEARFGVWCTLAMCVLAVDLVHGPFRVCVVANVLVPTLIASLILNTGLTVAGWFYAVYGVANIALLTVLAAEFAAGGGRLAVGLPLCLLLLWGRSVNRVVRHLKSGGPV